MEDPSLYASDVGYADAIRTRLTELTSLLKAARATGLKIHLRCDNITGTYLNADIKAERIWRDRAPTEY